MANQQQGRGNQRRRSAQKRRGPVDIWRSSPPLPDLEPVVVAHDMTALIRSLGEPPMNGVSNAAVHFATVIERTAAIAVALAALSPGLLADSDS